MTTPIPMSMRALVKKEEKESYVLETIPVPIPEDDDVLIKVDLVSICGSDIALYRWNNVARTIATIPFTPGHECTGVVVKCGPQSGLRCGQRVAVENHYFCGKCYQCTHDLRHICMDMGQFGHGRKTVHGGCSQYTIVPSKYCYQLQTDISAEEAVLLEPLGVAHNAVERAEVADEDVLVIGCGPVGLLTMACAKAMGAKRVVAADIDDSRRELATRMGADVTFNPKTVDMKQEVLALTGGAGIGRIVECSGAAVMISSMFTCLRKGGTVVMVGLPSQPIHVEDPLTNVVFKSVCLKTIHGRRIFHTWQEIERLVSEKRIDLKPVVSHRFKMSDYEEAFDTLFSGKACKIILDPQL